jgi:hypothetical protein
VQSGLRSRVAGRHVVAHRRGPPRRPDQFAANGPPAAGVGQVTVAGPCVSARVRTRLAVRESGWLPRSHVLVLRGGGIVKLFADEGFRDSLGSGWGGCGAVVRRLLGPVR